MTLSRARALVLLAALPFLTGCGYVAVLGAGYFGQSSQSKGGGGVVVVQTAEGVDLVVGRGPKDLGDTTEGRGEAVVAAQFRFGVTSPATLQVVRVTGQGTGDEGRITSVKLFHDLDGDGSLSSGEPQLGTTQTFSANDGQATFSDLGFGLQSGVAVDVLVVSELPTDALDGDTFRVELSDDQALEATTQVNGESVRIRVFGAPVSGGVRTISSTGTLTLSLGAQTPSAGGVFPNAQDVEVLQLDLRASSVEDIRIDSLQLQASGTLNDLTAIGTIELFEDSDNDGQLNRVTDVPLASLSGAPSDNGALAFTGLGRTLPKSSLRRWLLVYQLNGTGLDGQTFRADLNSASDVVGLGLSSNQAPAVQGAPVQGGATQTVQRAGLNLSVGPFNPARDATPAQSGVGVLQFRVAATGAEPVVVSSLGVRGTGSGNELSDLAGVRLYLDQDGDGELDAGESLLAGPASYPADDGTLTLGGFSRELMPGTVELWLVTYDLGASATGGDQFTATLAGPSTVAVSGRMSGLVLTPTVPAVSGGLLTVRGSLALALGATQPATPNRVLANSNDAPTLQLVVGAGAGESVRLTGLTLTPAGTGNDQLALSGVDLYEDVDLSGTVNGGDALIQTQNYPGDDLALTFSAAGGLLAGDIAPLTSRTLLVRYRLSGQALEGQTFTFDLPTTALAATGVSSARPIPASGPTLTTSGNPLQTQRARVTFGLGAENPNASDVLNGTTIPVLQLLASAGPGEALNLSALTFRSSGTANETAVVQQARLYLEGTGPRGTIDGTDVQLGAGQTFSADDGFVTFSGAPLTSIAISSSATLLLAYDILPSAPAGGSFTARLAAAGDVSGAGGASGLTPEVLGAPQTGQAKTISRGSLTTSLGTQNPPAANTFPNRSGVRVLQASLVAGAAETVRVSSLRLTAAGSADESTAIGGINLYLDLNQDGIVSGGDTLLASAASIANDGNVNLTGFNLDVPPGQTRSVLVTCDVTAAASAGTNLRFRIATPPADLVALGLTSAQAITPSGAALEGNVLSLVLGALTVSKPGSSPGPTTELNSGQGVPMLQLRCAANAIESARVSSLVLTHTGSGVPAAHVSSASLYHDVNGNGVLDGDTLLTTTTFAGTSATFTIPPGTFDVAQSSTRDLLVTYDFNGSAPVGATFSASLASNPNLSALGISSNLALPVTGAPLTGGLKTLEAASLSVAAGGANPAPGNALRNQAALVTLQSTLTAGSAEPVRVTSLRLSASGSLDLTTEVSRIRLYRENDPPNGVLDGDVLIGDQVGGFTAGAHTFALGASALQIPAGGSKAVLVVLDLAATAGSAGETVTLSLAANGDLVATGVVSGQPVTANGAPVSGNAQSVVEASLGLALGPNTPAGSDVAVVSSGVAVLQARLGAGSAEAVRVTSLRFAVSGSPTTGVTLARLYRDDNNNGALDGDVLLGSGTLGAGGDITFTPSAGTLDVASVGSRDVLLVLDFGNTASEGQTFTSSLPTNGDLVAQGLTSGLAITPTGAPLTGSTITTREGSLTVAAGTPPPAQSVFNNASGVSALHLSLQAGSNDGIRVTALTLRASGSADDTGLQVDLYRDTNGNGTLEGGEPLLQSQTVAGDDGTATFGFGAGVLEVAAGQTGFVLARVTLPGTASVGQTHSIRLQATGDVTAQGLSTAAPASILGAPPIQGPTLTAQATSLTLSGPVPQSPAENVFPNASEVRMLRVQLDAGALEAVRVTQLVFRPTGASTGDDTAATVSLYLDTNTNGTVEVGTDTLIQTQTGANASVTFAAGGGLVDVPASGSRQLLVTYALGAPIPSAGEGFQLALATADVTAQGLGSAAPVTAGGATQTGGLKTVAVGTLTMAGGANNPTAGEAFSGQTRVMQQLRLSAGVEAVRVDSLQIRHSGTGDPATDLTQVALYRDLNGNGQVDGDPLLDTATFSGVNATFSQGGGLLSVSSGSPVDLLVVYTFGASASEGETFSLLAGAPGDIVAVGVSSNATVTPSGAGAVGGAQTFRVGALTLATGPAPPAAGSIAVPTSRVAIQQLNLSATGEGARLQTLTIGFSGSGSVANVQTASLYLDSDGDGAVGALDTLIQALPMSAATVMFSQGGGLATVSTSSAVRLLVTYDLLVSASPGETYGADLVNAGEISATGEIGGAAITVSGSAAASNLQTVVASGTLVLSAGSSPPGAGSVFRNQSQAPIQQLRLSAGGENARVTDLTVNLTGTGAASALVQARLYADQNADGAIDAGDVLLGVATFSGTQATFSAPGGLVEVSAGTPRELLVAYDFNATGGIGNTFGTATIANSDLVATGVTTGGTLAPSGSVAASSFKTLAATGTLALSAGSSPPGAGSAFRNQAQVPIQQLRLSAGGENARITSLTITLAGTGASSALTQARLYADQNADGAVDAGDVLLGVANFTGTQVSFVAAGGLIEVTAGAPRELLVAYDFNATGGFGNTFGTAAIANSDLTAEGVTSGATLAPTGSLAASNVKTLAAQGTLALSAGSSPPGAGSAFRNQSQVPIQQLRLSAGGENARITSLTITLAGTGASSALIQARLYADQNADGAIDGGDVLLGVANFTGTQVSFVAAGGLIEVTAGAPRELLVAYDFNATGGIGNTFGVGALVSTDLVAIGVTSGATLSPTGSLAASNVKTLAASGSLLVANGPANPGAQNAGTTAVSVVAQQFSLSASGEGVILDSVAVSRAGTGTDGGVTQVRLFLDLNSNGLLDGDTQLATGTFAGGNVTLGAGNLTTIGDGTTARFLVVFDFAATGGETYQADSLAAVDVVSRGATSLTGITATGSAALGGLITIILQPVLNVTQTVLGDSSIYPTQSRSVALRLQINETASQPARLKQLSVVASGSADESSAISLIRLYRNLAPFGNEVGGEDVLIGLTAYFANNGTAVFAGMNELIPAGGSLELLVAYEVGGPSGSSVGETLIATVPVGGMSLEPDGGGAALTPTGLPLTGPVLTIGAQLQLSVGPNNPSGTIGVTLNETQAELLQLELSASQFNATISGLTLDASGSGDDTTIVKAELYRDANEDGILDGGDPLILSSNNPYGSNNGTFQFTGLSEVVAAGTSVRWLVSYDLGGTGSGGDSFTLVVDSTTDLASDAAVTTGTLPAQGATLELRGAVVASLGTGGLVGALHAGVGDQQVFHVALAVDAIENFNLASLAFVASGSVPDATWISAVQLWLDDGDDVFEPGGADTEIGSAQTFASEDGTVTFSGLGQTLTASTTTKLWVSLDLLGTPPVAGGAGFKLSLQAGGASLSGAVTGGTGGSSGYPVLGPLRLTSTFAPVQTQASAFTSSVRRSDIQTADMDLDGTPDIVALGSNFGIEVLLSDGGGSFVSKVERTFAGSGLLRSLALADFNRDGYPDVVVTTQNEVFVVLNQGTVDPGNLSVTVTQISGSVNELSGVEFGDIDRDGDLDVVAADVGSDELRHHINNGSGGFSLGTVLGFTGGVKLSGRFQLVDLDNDARLDYLLTARAGSTHFTIAYPGNGAGGAFTGTSIATGTNAQDVVTGRVAASGSPDVVSIDQAGSAYFSYPTGTPILSSGSTASTAGVSSFTQPRRIGLMDLDQDGSDDLVILHNGVDGVVAHIGSGSLSFPSSLAIDLPSGSDADRLAAADFDNDGDLDLVVVSSTVIGQELYYLEGQQVPVLDAFSQSKSIRQTWNQEPERIATGDFNRDGLLDYVLVSDGGERIAVFLQDAGGGSFTKGLDSSLGEKGHDVAVADVDRDGDLDLVASRSNSNHGLRIYKGDGTGAFGGGINRATSALDQDRLVLGDTNRDGIVDALGASQSSFSVQTFRGDGTDFGAGLVGDQTAIGDKPLVLVLADFNTDGILDLATVRDDKEVHIYPGLGNYAYGVAVTVNLNGAMGAPTGIMAGDLDDDGAQDLVVICDNNNMEIFKGDGSGGITSQGTRTALSASDGALVDLDNDGDLDVVLARDSGALVSIELTTRSTFTFAAPVTVTLSSGDNASGLAVGDFDGNGKADVILAAQTEVQVFLR